MVAIYCKLFSLSTSFYSLFINNIGDIMLGRGSFFRSLLFSSMPALMVPLFLPSIYPCIIVYVRLYFEPLYSTPLGLQTGWRIIIIFIFEEHINIRWPLGDVDVHIVAEHDDYKSLPQEQPQQYREGSTSSLFLGRIMFHAFIHIMSLARLYYHVHTHTRIFPAYFFFLLLYVVWYIPDIQNVDFVECSLYTSYKARICDPSLYSRHFIRQTISRVLGYMMQSTDEYIL